VFGPSQWTCCGIVVLQACNWTRPGKKDDQLSREKKDNTRAVNLSRFLDLTRAFEPVERFISEIELNPLHQLA